MNLSLVEELVLSKNIDRFQTEDLLTDYYIKEGRTSFKAAELAEANLNTFIGEVSAYVNDCNSRNISCLFRQITRRVVLCNLEYFEVLRIKNNFVKITWQEFEDLSGLIISICFGAIDTSITPRAGDGGIDFQARLPIISTNHNDIYGYVEVYGQSKHYTGNVGIYDIKSFVAFANSKKRNFVHPAQLFMFFTTSHFVPNAVKEIKENGFIGLNGMQLATIIYKHINKFPNNELLKKLL